MRATRHTFCNAGKFQFITSNSTELLDRVSPSLHTMYMPCNILKLELQSSNLFPNANTTNEGGIS